MEAPAQRHRDRREKEAFFHAAYSASLREIPMSYRAKAQKPGKENGNSPLCVLCENFVSSAVESSLRVYVYFER